MTEGKLLTPTQVAQRLQVNEHTVTQWLRGGHLRGFKIGKEWRVSARDLEAFLEESARPDLIAAVSGDSAPVPARATLTVVSTGIGRPTGTGRPTGPVQYFQRLLEAWGLDEETGVTLLGFEETSHLRDLLRGTVSLSRRDAKDRLRYLLEIDIALNALFRNEEAIKAWLRQPLEELGNESPLDHLREGSMEHLLRLNQLVEFLSGR